MKARLEAVFLGLFLFLIPFAVAVTLKGCAKEAERQQPRRIDPHGSHRVYNL